MYCVIITSRLILLRDTITPLINFNVRSSITFITAHLKGKQNVIIYPVKHWSMSDLIFLDDHIYIRQRIYTSTFTSLFEPQGGSVSLLLRRFTLLARQGEAYFNVDKS